MDEPKLKIRDSYRHLSCGRITVMADQIAAAIKTESNPFRYLLCLPCAAYFPLNEFVWQDDDAPVGESQR